MPQRAEHEFFKISITPPFPAAGELVINEILADNKTGTADPNGELEDWIELRNNAGHEIKLTGIFLSDNAANPQKWAFPNGTSIAAGGYRIVWADEDGSQPGLHANFRLKSSGEHISLATSDGRVLDSVSFGMQFPDRSFGRFPNGTGGFQEMPPTFSAENQLTSGLGALPENPAALRVAPNPASGRAQVWVSKNLAEAEIRLLDLRGHAVKSLRFEAFSGTEISLAGLPAGLYFLSVFSGGGFVGLEKLVVE